MLIALVAPTVRPVLLRTLSVPVVDVLALVRINDELGKLFKLLALLAVPAKIALLVVVSVIPGKMLGNVANKLACGTNDAPSYTIPTRLLFTYKLVMYLVAPTLSVIVSGIAPDVPWALENAGPTTINAAPVHTFNCALVVSYHRSPVTLDTGAVEELVAALIVLNILPL